MILLRKLEHLRRAVRQTLAERRWADLPRQLEQRFARQATRVVGDVAQRHKLNAVALGLPSARWRRLLEGVEGIRGQRTTDATRHTSRCSSLSSKRIALKSALPAQTQAVTRVVDASAAERTDANDDDANRSVAGAHDGVDARFKVGIEHAVGDDEQHAVDLRARRDDVSSDANERRAEPASAWRR